MLRKNAKIVLAAGGLDPSGLAGLLADARVFEKLRLAHAVAATAITAQNRTRFFSWQAVGLKLFREQLSAAPKKLAGIKIGMLADSSHARALADFIAARKPKLVLWDPVLIASTGTRLLKEKLPTESLKRLLRATDLLTPNIPEAEWLLGRSIDAESLPAALEELLDSIRPGGALILKGGHRFSGDHRDLAVDYFAERGRRVAIPGRRRKDERRGTGCSFASAWLANIILGKNRLEAARAAKRYVLDNVFDAPAP